MCNVTTGTGFFLTKLHMNIKVEQVWTRFISTGQLGICSQLTYIITQSWEVDKHTRHMVCTCENLQSTFHQQEVPRSIRGRVMCTLGFFLLLQCWCWFDTFKVSCCLLCNNRYWIFMYDAWTLKLGRLNSFYFNEQLGICTLYNEPKLRGSQAPEAHGVRLLDLMSLFMAASAGGSSFDSGLGDLSRLLEFFATLVKENQNSLPFSSCCESCTFFISDIHLGNESRKWNQHRPTSLLIQVRAH
jgi:hypothetical protein